MLNAQFFKRNRKKLLQSIGEDSLLVITAQSLLQRSGDTTFPFRQDSNFYYLTGLEYPDFILVLSGKEEFLILPNRSEAETIFGGATDFKEVIKKSGITNLYNNADGWSKYKQLQKQYKVVSILGAAPARVSGVDSFFTNPARRFLLQKLRRINKNSELKDIRPNLCGLRQIKQPEEIEAIKTAIKITDGGFKKARKAFNSGATEYELEAIFNSEFKKQQAPHGYQPIIAGGTQACVLHYIKNSNDLKNVNMCLLDVGAEYCNYSADITRMFITQPTKRQQKVYSAVTEVQRYATSILKAGLEWKDFAHLVELQMGKKLLELNLIKTATKDSVRTYFPHGIGHSLGLDVHDVCDYKIIQENMVITVEPGIYIPAEGIGIRIEDDILITKNGAINLSADIAYE